MNEYGKDGCYISFSGGKDSTVLVDIADKMGYNIPLVFVDTGLEYPEIRDFVKSYGDRVEWLKPKMNFKKVIEKYGYPIFSKEIADCVPRARKYLTQVLNEANLDRQTDRQTDRQSISGGIRSIDSYAGLANTKSLLEMSRGGRDRKWRQLQGIGEFAKRTDALPKRRGQPKTSNDVGMANERSADSGEYP